MTHSEDLTTDYNSHDTLCGLLAVVGCQMRAHLGSQFAAIHEQVHTVHPHHGVALELCKAAGDLFAYSAARMLRLPVQLGTGFCHELCIVECRLIT